MPQVGLAGYRIRVRELGSGEDLPLHDIGEGCDLLDVLRRYLDDLRAAVAHDAEQQKMLRVRDFGVDDRTATGIVETGEYGFEAELLNVQTQALAHHREVDEAEMLPFYFLAHIPTDPRGIVILERFRQYGVKEAFLDPLLPYFAEVCPGFRISLNPLVPAHLWTDVLDQGDVKMIRFIRYDVPSDIFDQFDAGHTEVENEYSELVIRTRKRRGSLPLRGMVEKLRERHTRPQEVIEISEFPYDEVKVEFESGGVRRTINLADLVGTRAAFDISDQVELDESGHPQFASIDELGTGYLAELLAETD